MIPTYISVKLTVSYKKTNEKISCTSILELDSQKIFQNRSIVGVDYTCVEIHGLAIAMRFEKVAY